MGGFLDFLPKDADFSFKPGALDQPMQTQAIAPEIEQRPGPSPQAQGQGLMSGLPDPVQPYHPGIMDRLRTANEPDARGLTLADKIFAAGSVMRGDSGGAMSYLQNQRAAADTLMQRDRQQALAQQGLKALQDNIDPVTGQLNFQGYLKSAGAAADPMSAIKLREGLRPHLTPMSGARGAVNVYNDDTGEVKQALAGDRAPESLFSPDGSINQNYIEGERQKALAVAKAQREGKPLAPKTGGAGKAKSYGEHEINWGG